MLPAGDIWGLVLEVVVLYSTNGSSSSVLVTGVDAVAHGLAGLRGRAPLAEPVTAVLAAVAEPIETGAVLVEVVTVGLDDIENVSTPVLVLAGTMTREPPRC
jgi:hypothetical protein